MSIHKYCHINTLQIFDSFVCKAVYSFWYTCSESGNRTRTPFGHQILSLTCLPVPPSALIFYCTVFEIKNDPLLESSRGGTYESRTRLKGFADLCVTAPPTRHLFFLLYNLVQTRRLELPRAQCSLAPQASASTNSATPA